jgi:adenylosuccinate lyase
MRRNLDASFGLVFSPRVLTALIESGLARDEAYRLVQAHALRAWEEETDFRALLEQDPAITARLGPDTIALAFDLEVALTHVNVVFARLAPLRAVLDSVRRESAAGAPTPASSRASSSPRTHEQEEVHA